MINVQEWLDQNYPKEGFCLRKNDDEGRDRNEGWNDIGKKRSEIIKLDIRN